MKATISRFIILTAIIALTTTQTNAQDLYAAQRQSWLKKAEEYKPMLTETIKHPTGIVKLEKDAAAFHGFMVNVLTDSKRSSQSW